MKAKFSIGDKVKAACKFREERFRFEGVKMITALHHEKGIFGYVLDGVTYFMYYARDLQLFCNHSFNEKCNSCQYRFRCYTIK